MTTFTTKLAALAIAASAFAVNPLVASDAFAKPMGGGGGGFKMGAGGFGGGSGFKPGPIGKGPGMGPIKIGAHLKPIGPKPFPPIKVGPIKPLPPICKGPGCFPKPPHHGHHGKWWVFGGVTILASQYAGCGYEYYMWKSTGSPRWHFKYAECRGWE